MSKTVVYRVKLYDVGHDEFILSRRMATEEGAKEMGGSIVEGSGFVIDLTDLENGEQWTARDFDPVRRGYKKAIDQS